MEIYVQSAGVSQQQDYIWQQITQTEQKRVDEPILVKDFKGLLETEAPSILIGRKNDQLILLVTGMKSSKRKDYRNRTIRNSIALIDRDNPVNEQKIRGIAVLALMKSDLENRIDIAIESGGKFGFKVDYKQVENIIEESLQTKDSNTRTDVLMIGKNSDKNKNEIANQLQQNRLPKLTNDSDALEALVVVTGIKTENALINARVWRGLSDLVEKENLTKYANPKSLIDPKLLINLIVFLGAIGLIILYVWSQNFLNQNSGITYRNKQPTILVAAISPGGDTFVTVDSDSKMEVNNTQDQTNNTIENNALNASIKSVALSSNGSYVVTGNDTGKVQLWDVNSKKKIEIINDSNLKHDNDVLSVAINASGNSIKIVSGGADGKVLLWTGEVKEGKFIPSIQELPK